MGVSTVVRRSAIALLAAGACATAVMADDITVTQWGNGFYGAPYAVAIAKGYFKEAGVNVTGILTAPGGGTSVRNTLAGDLPFGEVGLAAALEAIKAGQPIRIVSSGAETNADSVWVTKPDSPISSIKDVVGKKIGYTSPRSGSQVMLLMSLKHAGIDPSKVEMIPVGGGGANLAAVLNGSIDAGNVIEPVWSANKHRVKAGFWVKDVLPPNMTQTVGIVTTQFAQAQPDKVRAIIAARRRGVEFIYANPDEAADINAKAYNIDSALVREVFRHFLEIRFWGLGGFDFPGMNLMVEGLQLVGIQQGPVDWAQVTDASFLPADLRTTK